MKTLPNFDDFINESKYHINTDDIDIFPGASRPRDVHFPVVFAYGDGDGEGIPMLSSSREDIYLGIDGKTYDRSNLGSDNAYWRMLTDKELKKFKLKRNY